MASINPIRILLAGSSHTRLFFPFMKNCLEGIAVVTRLPYDAGRTDEILSSLTEWPLEGQDVVHVYSGHRDLMLNDDGLPFVNPGMFERNLRRIIGMLSSLTNAKIVFSNIPPVAGSILRRDSGRNHRIIHYNSIINDVAGDSRVPVHDFYGFALRYQGGGSKYLDGVHFNREFYREFGRNLSDYLIKIAPPRG